MYPNACVLCTRLINHFVEHLTYLDDAHGFFDVILIVYLTFSSEKSEIIPNLASMYPMKIGHYEN